MAWRNLGFLLLNVVKVMNDSPIHGARDVELEWLVTCLYFSISCALCCSSRFIFLIMATLGC